MKFAKNKLVSGKVIVQAVLELNSVMAVGMMICGFAPSYTVGIRVVLLKELLKSSQCGAGGERCRPSLTTAPLTHQLYVMHYDHYLGHHNI